LQTIIFHTQSLYPKCSWINITVLIFVYYSVFTTCFDPAGSSSGSFYDIFTQSNNERCILKTAWWWSSWIETCCKHRIINKCPYSNISLFIWRLCWQPYNNTSSNLAPNMMLFLTWFLMLWHSFFQNLLHCSLYFFGKVMLLKVNASSQSLKSHF
jgi:hypothetical protein